MKIKNSFKKIFFVLVFVLTLSFTNNVFADTISYYYGNTKINGIFPSYYTPGEELDLPIGEQVAPTVGEHGRFVIDNLYDNPELTGNPITKILATDSGDKTFYMEGHYNVYCVYVKKYSSDTWSNSECVRIGDNYNLGINNVNKADQIDPATSVHFRNYYNEHYAHVKIHYEKNGWDVYDATYHRLIQHYNDGESFVVPNYDIEIKPSYIETRVSPEFEEVVGTYGWISTSYKAQPEFDPNYPTNYVSNYLVNSYTGTSDITVEPIYQVNQICHYMIEGEYEYFHEVPCGTIITLPVNDTATTYYYGYHEFHNADNSPDYVSDTYLKTENVANGWRVSNQGYYYDGDQVAILKDNTLISRYTRTIRHTLYDAPEIDDPHFIEWRVKQSNTWFEYTEHDVLNIYQDIYPLYDYPTSKISFYSTYTDDQGLHLNPLAVYRYYTLDVDSMKLTNNLNYFENETNQVSYYPALGFYLPNVSSINKNYRFVEFYDNPEFTGDPITYIEPNENGGDITLYVKEVHNNTLNNLYPDKHVTVTFHSHIANGWPAEGFRDYTEEEYYLKSEDGYAHVAITNDHFAYSWQSGVGNYVRLNYHVGDEIVDTELVDFTFYDPAKEGDQSSVVYQWRDADGNIYNRSNYDNSHDNIYLFDHDIDLYSIDFDYDSYLPIAGIVEADWLGRSISWDWTRTYPCDAPEGMICYWSDEPNGDPIIKSNTLFYNNSYLKRNYSEMREDNIFDFITMKWQSEREISNIDLYAVYVVPTEHSVTLPYVVDVAYEEVPYELPGHNIPKASEVVATLTADEYTSHYINEDLDENGRYTSNVVRKYNPFGWRIEGTDYVYPFESEINVDDDITLVPEYTGSIQPANMPAKKSLQNVRFDLTLTERRLNDYVLGNAYFGQENAEVYVENVEQKINFDYGLEGDEEHYEYWEGPYGSINLAKLYKIGAKYNSPDLVAFEIYVNGELVDVEESEVYQDEDSSDYEQFYYIRSSEYDPSHNENDYNITVKAVYDEDINTYTIKDTTGLYFDTIEYTELSDDIVIPNPTKLGYIFTGWTFNYNCRTGIGECNSSLSSLVKNVTIAKGSAKIFSNIQLTPNFEEKQVTVTKYDNRNNSTIEVYDYGYEYNLGVNDYTYSSVLYDAKVTFVHTDQTEESGYVAIGNKANGWLVDSTHYDNNTDITLVNDITIRPDKTEVKTSPEFPATQNGYGWYTESGERLIGYTGTKNITLYEMPANETYEIIFGVETDGPRGATNPDFSTLTYSKNNLHYGDTFQVPSLDEYPDEDFCFTHCYKNKYNTWWLTNFFSEDEGWKPELYLHYMDDDDTVKDASKDTLYLQTKKKKLRLYYEEYDSYHRLINTVDRYLEYGGTYTFDYNRNIYDVGLQQDGGTNSYTRVNIHRVGEPMGVVVEIPEHYNPGYETNDVEIPEGYEFDGWYTEPDGQGEKYSYEAFKYKYLDKATVTDIYYATVDDLEDRIIKDYDTTNFTGFEPIHLYAHYVPKRQVTVTNYLDGESTPIVEVYDYGDTYTFGTNEFETITNQVSSILFNFNDNHTETRYVTSSIYGDGWEVSIGESPDTQIFADGATITLTDDMDIIWNYATTSLTSPEFPVPQPGYAWYDDNGTKYVAYKGTRNLTLYEQTDSNTYKIIFGVDSSLADNFQFEITDDTFSKENLRSGDMFTTPAYEDFKEGYCWVSCYDYKHNIFQLNNAMTNNEWKPTFNLYYNNGTDAHDTNIISFSFIFHKTGYDIKTSDNTWHLELGQTYPFVYGTDIYETPDFTSQNNAYARVNMEYTSELDGTFLNITDFHNPPESVIPEGYEFVGWYTDPVGGDLITRETSLNYFMSLSDAQELVELIKSTNGQITGYEGFAPVSLYAHYEPKQTTTHTVTYPNGDTYEVEHGQTHTLLSNNESKASENIATVTFKYSDNRLPDATSYVQNTYMPNGWLIGDTNYADGTDIVVNEDIVLVPDFVETTIDAIFPEVVDNDYYRSEWRTRSYCGGGSLVTSYNGTSDITYYESYKRVLHFDEDNGTPIYTKTFCENDYLLCSDALGYAEKDGAYFLGWTLYIDGEEVAYYSADEFEANGGPGSELSFDSYYLYNNEGYALAKADYSLMSYYISYNLNGGTVSGNPRSYTIEDEITLNNPTKEGFEFAGWGGTGLTGTNNMTVTIPVGSTGSRSYTAYWSTNKTITLGTNDIDRPDEVLATVTFNPHNGGAITTSDVIKTYTPNGWLVNGKHYVDGETIIVPIGSIAVPNFVERIIPAIYPSNPTKDGYEFEGWYDDATEGNKVSAYSGNEDITLHARYTDNYAYLDVNFNFNQKLLDLVTSDEVKNFRKATLEEYNDAKDEFGNGNDITGSGSPKRVYMWKNGKDILYYSDADVIYFPEDSSEYFAYIPYIRVLDISGLNTSKVINMTSMFERNEDDFYNKYRFTEINLSNFDTHNVTSMSRMFYGQAYLKVDLDLSNFDTHNVIDMSGMFHLNGKTVDISNFDTSKVTNMSGMFNKFHGDDVIGIENLDTSKVTNMSYMFSNSHFYNLDLSGWDVSNVTNMEYMFERAAYLANVDVSTWDVSKVEKMTHMFYYDFNLNVLDLRSWDTSNVVYTAEMFARCRNLNTIYVSDKWNMDSVLYGLYMFDENNSIVGEKGTTYDETNIDFDYAHIDDAPTNPGYLSERLYETPKYTITFDGGEYFPTTSRLVDAGTPIGNMPTYGAVYNNYGEITFGGWYTDQTYTTEVTPDFIPIGNITYYAKPLCNLGYPGDVAPERPTEIVGLVTFEPHNGEQAFTSFIYKDYYARDKWLVDGQIYHEYDNIVLYPNISIEPYYEGEIQEVFFPTRLTYVGHNFLGWFTEEEGGTQLTSYNQEESITLHAHWEGNGKNICTYSNGKIEECETGKSYRVPSNEYVKIGKVSEIVNGYGAYENAVYNTYDIYAENIINSYEIDGILYYPGDNYVINGDTYITVDGYRSYVSTVYLDSYVDVEVDSEWFAGEEKYFLGWFTEPIGGEQIITYNGAESINVYAHYYDNPDDAVLLTFNGIQDSYEIKVLKGTEFTPYDEGEEYTAYFNLDYQDSRPLVPGYQRQYIEPTGFAVNDRVIDVGDTVVINEDTLVTTLSDGYKSELSDFETPYKEGYIFKGWYDAPEDGNFANFNSEDFYVYTDTYYAQYAPYNSEEDVIVDFDGEKFVYPRGTVLTLPDDREKEGKYLYADFYDGTDYVGYVEIETSYTLRNFTVNNVEYDIGADITLNEDTVIRSNFDEVPNYDDYTLDQYPDLVYPNFPDFGLGDTFYGWFDKPTGGKQYYDASEFTQDEVKLFAIYIDDNQIPITVDGEVIIVNKGLGNLPNSKNKKSENIAEITFDYNKEGYTNETAYITKDYTFDHFTIDGEGNYMPNQEYNFTHSIAINSVYTESYNYPEIPTVTDESFQGWYTNKTGGDLVTSLEGITSDTTLYANWNNNKVTICVNDECNEVPAGSTHNLGQNTDAKASEIISTVTFNPTNGEENVTSNVTKQFMPNGWLVNGVHYDDNADITVDVYTTVIGDYIETVIPAEFPTDPTKDNYEFIGWYDDSLDGNKIESYAGDSDITLYAHWSLDLPQPGEEFNLPENTETKTKTIATVTFVYGNGSPNTTSKVTRPLIGNGWLVNGVHYNGGETIVYEEGMTIVEDYINGDIVPAVFPSNPTKQNATFAGWYDTNAEAGGNRYTEYSKASDITLYARWQKTKPECTSFEPYTTGINNIQKADEVISTVTFVYHNGQANTTTNVLAAYSPNGWVNNGTHYGNEQTISKCTTEDVEPDYDVIIKNGKFPTDPTRVGYEFVGWFTKETGGEQVTVLRGNEDITLHAHWTSSYSIITTGLNQFYGSMSLKPGTRIALDKALSYHNISEENVETNLFATADIYNIAVEGLPTYVWYDNMDSATYYYSDAEVIFYARDDVYDETPFYESYWFIDLSGLNTSKTTSMRNLFEDSTVNSIRFGNFDTHNVTDMSNMFHHARNLEYFDLSGFDTSNVTDMTSMFAGMIYKEELDVSSFDTSNVTSMSGMFEYDKSLTRLDLSNFDTHNVTDMGVMFYTEDPSNLEKIYVSDKWDVSNVTNSHDMFTNAVNIVGQNGTTYDSDKVDKEYAIIDDAPEHPGYLSIRGEISHEENNQKDLLCKRAKIESQSEHTGYCSSNIAWCNENNISGEFSFGNINTTGDLQAGDALVCDVNGDGMFDDREERFYYVSDYYDTETKRFNSSIAALIWYDDYASSSDTRMKGYITYDESENGVTTGYGGPTGLLEEYDYVVPAKISWGNVSLYKEDRYILPALEDLASPTLFSYAGYTGRLLTVKEIEKACGINVTEKKNYSLPESCLFLFEHAMTTEDWYSGPYWIETPGDATSTILMQSGYLKFKDNISDSWNARPVIDVPKSKIEGAKVTHTIYYPDDTSDVVDDGVTYALRTNDSTKEDTSGVKVTFDYNDGVTKPYVTSIKDTYVANGWLIDNTHYENGQIVVVNSDLTVEYDYITTTIGITFPSNPERVGYTFDGWFDENDVEYTSYNGDEDITLYAHWSVSTGPIVLPVNDASKEPTNYAVTFKYNNGSDDTTSNVVVSYTPNGWLLDGVHVADGTEVTLVETSELVRDYSKNITPATFPENPTRTGYTFQGWFNSLFGGNKYTSYDREEDITLYAHWYEEGATRKITLGTNTEAKADEIISTVTFLPHNGESAIVSNVVKKFTPNGWIIDGVNYPNGATVEVPIGAVVEPYYIETISNAQFPENPTKDGYEFTGWYTLENGGEKVTVLRDTQDLILHAQYTNNYSILLPSSEMPTNVFGYGALGSFKKATLAEYNMIKDSIADALENGGQGDVYVIDVISTDDSPKPTYAWLHQTNDDVLYYSEADVIFMNEDSSNVFSHMGVSEIDLTGLNSSKVTDMRGMLNGNYSLVILDVSNLDTHNVIDMSDMFNECSELTHIDLSSFDTSKVTDMNLMFSNMSNLAELDLSNFDTHNVTNMSGMFYYDTSLTDVNLSSFDTSNVEDMNNMFYYNGSLEELDLSSFDTHNVAYFSSMFEGDDYLRTIYASELWSTESDNGSYDVFYSNYNLVGQEGTIYDDNHTDSEYARIDKSSIGEPGYLTYKGSEKDFALLDEGYSINSKISSLSSNPTTFRKATKNEYNAIKDSLTDDNIISLEYSPKEVYLWQSGDDLLYYSDASTIYMNPSSSEMFYYMETLENIDLSGLNTEHVIYMESLFYNCSNLRNVNLSSFNTSNVTDMDYMFYTTNLEALDLRMFDTSNVTDMNSMFQYSNNLKNIDLSSFDTSNVTDMSHMFEGDENLTTVYVSDRWNTDSINYSNYMFESAYSIVGQEGTTYDENHIDIEYAHVDGGPSNPGYLTYKEYTPITNPELNIYTVTLPDRVDIVYEGEEYLIPENDYSKDNENLYAVTFKYQDGKTEDEIRYISNKFTNNGWTIDGVHYNDDDTIVVTKDIVLNPDYTSEVIGVEFPSDPTRDNYTFEGWYNGDTKYTSYEGTEDIILTAKWTGIPIIVCDGNDCREEPYGTEIDLGVNNRDKNDTVVSTVTYDYHFDDGSDNPYEYVMKQYTPNGWLVNGVHYDDNANITITENTNIKPDYLETIIPVNFPETVNRQGYIFKGWYTQATGGEKMTSYAGENSILVHAQYDKEKIIVEEPDGEHEYEYGDEYTFKAVPTKVNENIAEVTFKPENGDDDIVRYVQKQYTPVDWILNGTHYNEGDKITLTENIKPTPQYTENVIPVSFPEDPEKEHYVFEGWFNNDTKYIEYEGSEDIILTAEYSKEKITVTNPDGTEEEYEYGDEYTFKSLPTKNDDNVAVVTFKPENGSADITRYVTKSYTAVDWLLNGTHYNPGDKITLTENIQPIPQYTETITGATFPADPEKEHYVFEGWYNNDTKYTSYQEEEDIVLTAQYSKEKITVTNPDGTEEEYEYGDEYTFKSLPTKNDDNVAVVTFKPENGSADITRYVTKSYTAVNWLLNGAHYNPGDKITLTENIQPIPQYTETIIGAEFPADPEKEHYVFEGWFNNDVKYTEYEGTDDIILTAEYSKEKIIVIEPDGEHEYEYGDEYEFKATPTKDNENIALVTFKPENGSEDIERYVQKTFTPYGWMIGDTHYNEGDKIELTENIQPVPYYVEIVTGVEFPDDPEKEFYIFEGWYNGETKYTSYSGTEDLILTAVWSEAGPTSITINTTNMVIVKGETKDVDITTDPINLNQYLTYTGYSDIITVSEDGEVEGIEVGETTITVSTTNNPDIEETINVKVIDNKITSDVYTVTTKDKTGEEINIIIGSPEQVTINDYLDNINNENEYLKVYNKDDELVSDYDELITTGYTIKLVVDEQELDSVRVIIRGDVDQDGYIDVSDKLAIKRHILEIDVIDDYRLYAADLDVDPEATAETMIDVSDNLKLALYILEKIESLNEEVGD